MPIDLSLPHYSFPFFPADPDFAFAAATFGDGTYMSRMTATGDQAYVDLQSTSGARGLRMTIGRTLAVGTDADGWRVNITAGTASAVTIDADAPAVNIVQASGDNLGAIKTLIDAVTGLSSAYYASGKAADGQIAFLDVQATALLRSQDDKAEGLTVTLGTEFGVGADSNGWRFIVDEEGNAVTVDTGNKTVHIGQDGITDLADTKAAIDAVDGLTSSYAGGAGAGSSPLTETEDLVDGDPSPISAGGTHAPEYETDNGVDDTDMLCRIAGSQHVWVSIGTDAPDDDSKSYLCVLQLPHFFRVPAGMSVFVKRAQNTDAPGSIHGWRAP